MKTKIQESYKAVKENFLNSLTYSAGTMLIIHLLPKSHAPYSFMRLLCTIAYFAASFYLLYTLWKPRSNFMYKWYEMRYKDCSQLMEKSIIHFMVSLDRLIAAFLFVLALFVLSNAILILGYWLSVFAGFASMATKLWWISIIVLVLFPFLFGGRIHEAHLRHRTFHEQLKTSDFVPLKISESVNEKKLQAVTIKKDYTFNIGGIDWSWHEFYKSCIVFGQPGSGKTICVLNAMLDAFLGSSCQVSEKPGGLILDPKGDFNKKIYMVCRKNRRANDLVVIDPINQDISIKWNPLDSDDDELELAGRFAAVMASLGMKDKTNSFWIDSAKKFIRHSIALIRLTNSDNTPPSFEQIYELASSFDAISQRVDQLDLDNDDCDQCLRFFADEWFELAEETRTSIQAYITNMIDPFLMQPYRHLFSGKSTITINEIIKSGKILYVNMPIADKEVMAKMVGTFVKLEFFREVLKYPDKTRSSFFMCDEFQSFFTTSQGKGDADFFERSRQSNHINLISTQNMNGLYKQTEKKESVKNLLSNCAIKIFLRNTDNDTNKYASELFGKKYEGVQSISLDHSGGKLLKGNLGHSARSVQNLNYQLIPNVRLEEFQQLIVPDLDSQSDYCESIVHLGSRSKVKKEKLKWKVHPIC
ncbi:TRAG protein [Candidatus Magnetomorum sp. HK-1]|nr:TRAG protein [Candidatus Magnetomorum sp. HK-1]